MSSFGHNRERQVKALMEAEGWVVIRSPASLGAFDLTMIREGYRPRVCEIKATAAGPYAGFGPRDRADLIAIAEKAGADAYLGWWPKRGKLKWIPACDWPPTRGKDQ